jgi:GT2 family glycosyltransferase
VRSRGQAQRHGLEAIWYPPYLPFVGGCGLGVRRAQLEKMGGFAEDLPYLEDVDLSLRLQRAGVNPVFVPEAVVYVRFREELAAVFRQARRWAQYNVLIYKRRRPAGVRIPHPWREYGRRWRLILRRLRRSRGRIGRYRLAWQIGWHIGLLIGSIRYRVAPAVHTREGRAESRLQHGPPPDSPRMEGAEPRTRLAG